MEKITLEESLIFLKEKFPGFIPYWETESINWDEQGIISQMEPFARYTIDIIKTNNLTEIKKIFTAVEFLICNGTQTVQDGMATVYLEYLMSKDSDEIQFTTFAKYLGENSIGYCRAWDKFCGVKTKGLYDDAE